MSVWELVYLLCVLYVYIFILISKVEFRLEQQLLIITSSISAQRKFRCVFSFPWTVERIDLVGEGICLTSLIHSAAMNSWYLCGKCHCVQIFMELFTHARLSFLNCIPGYLPRECVLHGYFKLPWYLSICSWLLGNCSHFQLLN